MDALQPSKIDLNWLAALVRLGSTISFQDYRHSRANLFTQGVWIAKVWWLGNSHLPYVEILGYPVLQLEKHANTWGQVILPIIDRLQQQCKK